MSLPMHPWAPTLVALVDPVDHDQSVPLPAEPRHLQLVRNTSNDDNNPPPKGGGAVAAKDDLVMRAVAGELHARRADFEVLDGVQQQLEELPRTEAAPLRGYGWLASSSTALKGSKRLVQSEGSGVSLGMTSTGTSGVDKRFYPTQIYRVVPASPRTN